MVAPLLLACALVLALAGCDRGTGWAGGPTDPGLVRVSLGPSLSPVDDAVRTGIVIHDQELVLFLIPGGDPPDFGMVWVRRPGTPIPALSSVPGTGFYDPWPPDRYPLISVYDSAGRLVVSARLRDVATELKGG